MRASNTTKLYRAARQKVQRGNYLWQIPAVYSNITQSQTLKKTYETWRFFETVIIKLTKIHPR